MFQNVWGVEKFYEKWGAVTIYIEIFQSHSTEKLRGESFCISEDLSIEKASALGGYHVSPEEYYG